MESTPLRSVLRIKKATDALTDFGALTDVGRKASKARGTKESLVGDAREALGETIVTPGDAGETIATPGNAEEPPTTSTRNSHKTAAAIMKSSLRGHSSGTVSKEPFFATEYLRKGQLVGPKLPKEE